jgi:hypothetical protein
MLTLMVKWLFWRWPEGQRARFPLGNPLEKSMLACLLVCLGAHVIYLHRFVNGNDPCAVASFVSKLFPS